MCRQVFAMLIVMGAFLASTTSASADGRTHYQIFYDACVATHGDVALAKKHAEAVGWKENKRMPAPEGSLVKIASWMIFQDKTIYSVFVSTGGEALFLDHRAHPDLVGVPSGICWVATTQADDTIAVDSLKSLLNVPGCEAKKKANAPQSAMYVHWPMRGPGYAISYGFARYTTKDVEGTLSHDVLGRNYAASYEQQSKAFVRSSCEVRHPVNAPAIF